MFRFLKARFFRPRSAPRPLVDERSRLGRGTNKQQEKGTKGNNTKGKVWARSRVRSSAGVECEGLGPPCVSDARKGPPL